MANNSQSPLSEESIEKVNAFLAGKDPMEHIVAMECDYQSDKVSIIYVRGDGEKRIAQEGFKPFCWVKQTVTSKMFDGDREAIRSAMRKYGIACKGLKIKNPDQKETQPRLLNGFKFQFYATRPMAYNKFLRFFEEAGTPIYSKKKKKKEEKDDKFSSSNKDIIALAPIEQHMISTGKRLFKGYEGYDELKRFIFDLETQGLNPKIHRIDQIGVRTNKGLEKIISVEGNTNEEKDDNELMAIIEFLCLIKDEKPDIVIGHNSENFDWNFIIERLIVLGTTIQKVSELVGFNKTIHKRSRQAVLKLGGEMEKYYPTVMWGHNIIDSLHAVRRAQAIDSSMKSASLKYVTKYLKQKKDNRVYVPGEKIGTIWADTSPNYAFNNENGDWFKITDEHGLESKYERVTGKYIVERYLLDDLWETDKVELKLNESNFLVSKILPTTFTRACTMGTAGIWKLIVLAWCFEHDLAIPAYDSNKSFTGGLSRLLKTGYVKNVAKLDYNSLYPSIILTWMIDNGLDIDNVLLSMLNYVLTQRERYKGLKKEAGKGSEAIVETIKAKLTNPDLTSEMKEEMGWNAVLEEINKGNVSLGKEDLARMISEKNRLDAEESSNDKKQLPLKILGNSYFGSLGCPSIFPLGWLVAAEKTTCIGRQCLRLMIYHFSNIALMTETPDDDDYNYEPIVGDSFTGDTPVYVRNKINGMVDIRPISELIDTYKVKTDILGREYDYSEKPYQVLCRSGWRDVNYIYRHKTNKPIYTLQDGNNLISVTEDHSLYNEDRQKIKPSEITESVKLERYTQPIKSDTLVEIKERELRHISRMLGIGKIETIPMMILNGTKESKVRFLELLEKEKTEEFKETKLITAQLEYIKKAVM